MADREYIIKIINKQDGTEISEKIISSEDFDKIRFITKSDADSLITEIDTKLTDVDDKLDDIIEEIGKETSVTVDIDSIEDATGGKIYLDSGNVFVNATHLGGKSKDEYVVKTTLNDYVTNSSFNTSINTLQTNINTISSTYTSTNNTINNLLDSTKTDSIPVLFSTYTTLKTNLNSKIREINAIIKAIDEDDITPISEL